MTRRTEMVSAPMTADEARRLTAAASTAGISRSELIRQAVDEKLARGEEDADAQSP